MASGKRKSKGVNTTDSNDRGKKSKMRYKGMKSKSTSVSQGISIATKAISILIGLFGLTMFCTNKYVPTPTENIANLTTESTILHQYSKMVLDFFKTQQKMIHALKEEPVADLIKLRLRPIQERLASLRTQTSQYEKLERIPGGPTNFMSTTIAELDFLSFKIKPLDFEVIKIMSEIKNRKYALILSGWEAVSSQDRMHAMFNSENQYMFHVLARQGIDLFPLNITEEATEAVNSSQMVVRNLTKSSALPEGGVTPLELAEKLEAASKLFAQREVLQKKLSDAFKALGASSIQEAMTDPETFLKVMEDPESGAVVSEFNIVSGGIKEIIEVDGKTLNLTVPWIREANLVLGALMKALNDDGEKNNPYVDLRNIVMTDIQNLRTRVENLQYSYLKVQAEPLIRIKIT